MANIERRGFITGAFLAGAAGVAGCRATGGAGGTDENLSVLISDLHIGGANPKWAYTKTCLSRVVDEVLAMSPRPKRVIAFGDVARTYGLAVDYEASKPILMRLVDAGVELHLTMGNHDRRSNFLKQWPEYAKNQLVPGRFTQVVSLGGADLVLLDTLKGTDDRAEDDMGPVEGEIDAAQLAWFDRRVAAAKRPFFVGSHQFRDLYCNGEKPIVRAAKSKYFAGWIFGHDHEWTTESRVVSWRNPKIAQTLVLPSTGLWGDIGYVTLRTTDRAAEFEMHQHDFYFNAPVPAAERPRSWDLRIRDNDGARRHFAFDAIA